MSLFYTLRDAAIRRLKIQVDKADASRSGFKYRTPEQRAELVRKIDKAQSEEFCAQALKLAKGKYK